jgi:hypothetical protein
MKEILIRVIKVISCFREKLPDEEEAHEELSEEFDLQEGGGVENIKELCKDQPVVLSVHDFDFIVDELHDDLDHSMDKIEQFD